MAATLYVLCVARELEQVVVDWLNDGDQVLVLTFSASECWWDGGAATARRFFRYFHCGSRELPPSPADTHTSPLISIDATYRYLYILE